jgi:predicted nucleotide-binding protein
MLLVFIGSFDDRHHGHNASDAIAAGFDHDLDPMGMGLVSLLTSQFRRFLSPPNVLYVEDDKYQAIPYEHAFRDAGFKVTIKKSVRQCLAAFRSHKFDVIVLDVMMSGGKEINRIESAGGFRTGLALARKIRESDPSTPLVALTNSVDVEVTDWFGRTARALYLNKATTQPRHAARLIARLLRLPGAALNIFLVHGRSESLRRELQRYLIHDEIGVPIVLADQPSKGMTLIEKLEHYGTEADVVFVLATPDDVGRLAGRPEEERARARQNVIFEAGYFLGQLRRLSGRIFLLHGRELEWPSDMNGIVYIDVSEGIPAAWENIKRELRQWL